MTKPKTASRARYTLEFKQEAVRLIEGGQSIAAVARTLCMVDQTLFNWVKAKREGKLSGADSKPVSAEQIEIEIARLRAELARVKMEQVGVAGYQPHFVRRARNAQRRHLSDDALLVGIRAIQAQTRSGYG